MTKSEVPTRVQTYQKKQLLCSNCGQRTFKPRRYCGSRHHVDFANRPYERRCCQDCCKVRNGFNWHCVKCAKIEGFE